MKRILLAIIAAMVVLVPASGQGHLKFKGLLMKGKTTDFEQKLADNGFQKYKFDAEETWMMGPFGGLQNCAVCLLTREKTGMLIGIKVYFPCPEDSWISVKDQYEMLKRAYAQKYGEPDVLEKIERPYREGDGLELQAIRKGKGQYQAIYRTTVGMITLSIASTFSSHVVCAEYTDVDVLNHVEAEFDEDLMNDI